MLQNNVIGYLLRAAPRIKILGAGADGDEEHHHEDEVAHSTACLENTQDRQAPLALEHVLEHREAKATEGEAHEHHHREEVALKRRRSRLLVKVADERDGRENDPRYSKSSGVFAELNL